MREEYVIDDDFSEIMQDGELETPEERKAREREERTRFLGFMLAEHREVVWLQVVALAAATLSMIIVLIFHPVSDSAFHEARQTIGASGIPQPPVAFFLLVGMGCAVLVYLWPLLEGRFAADRWQRLALLGFISAGALSPLLLAGILIILNGDTGSLMLSLVLYGELLVYSAPLPLAVVGISYRRQELAVSGMILITGSVFAGLSDPELDFNLMDPSFTDVALIYVFAIAILVFMEGTYLSVRLSTYLETIYSGGTGVPAELNIGRIIRTFFFYLSMAAGVSVVAGFFALNYGEVLLDGLPEVMRSSRELSGVYGKVIFSTIFLLGLVVVRMIFPDLSRRVGQRTHAPDEEEETPEEESHMVEQRNKYARKGDPDTGI